MKSQPKHSGVGILPGKKQQIFHKSYILLIIGSPGSGKTSMALKISQEKGYHHIDMDSLTVREETKNNKEARVFPIEIISLVRKAKSSTIISGICKNYKKVAKMCDEVWLIQVEPDILYERVQKRIEKTGHGRTVPDEKWKKWAKDWLHLGEHFEWLEENIKNLKLIDNN